MLKLRLLRSRWIARVCRTVLFFLLFVAVMLPVVLLLIKQFYRILGLTGSQKCLISDQWRKAVGVNPFVSLLAIFAFSSLFRLSWRAHGRPHCGHDSTLARSRASLIR